MTYNWELERLISDMIPNIDWSDYDSFKHALEHPEFWIHEHELK